MISCYMKRKRMNYKIQTTLQGETWLLAVNRDHGINKTRTSFIESIIRKWKTTLFVPTTEGLITIGPIDIKRGIICKVTLFVLHCSL